MLLFVLCGYGANLCAEFFVGLGLSNGQLASHLLLLENEVAPWAMYDTEQAIRCAMQSSICSKNIGPAYAQVSLLKGQTYLLMRCDWAQGG